MVNLRFHVVSLIAVFLALALGVFLGAGPLQKTIGGETEGLQQEIAELADQNDSLSAETAELTSVVEGVAAEVVPGSLQGKSVALLVLPGTSEAAVASVTQALNEGGADIVGSVQLGEAAVALGQRDYRESLATPVAGHLDAGAAGTADQTLAAAIVSVLTTEGPERDLLAEILTDPSSPLIVGDSLPGRPAGSLVLVSSAIAEKPSEDDLSSPSQQAVEGLAAAVSAAPDGAIAVGSAVNEWDFISVLRQVDAQIPTVDSIGSVIAKMNVPLALAAGQPGAYGVQEGAKQAVAPIG